MKNLKYGLFTLIITFVIVCNLVAQEQTPDEPPVITIFIHGTKPQIPYFLYQLADYFFLPGLKRAQKQYQYHGPKEIINGLIDSNYVDPREFFLYGWSGKLTDPKYREEAAHTLKDEIEKRIRKYTISYGIRPKIRIIAHSHGGNVALNLAHDLESDQSDIILDEVILLATPVQEFTNKHIKSKNIGKLYHFYSDSDWIQLLDPQRLWAWIYGYDFPKEAPLLSKRTFDHHENLTQINTEINGMPLWHTSFIDILYPKKLREKYPYLFPRFLPELGRVMQAVKDPDVQEHIAQTGRPVKAKIDTRKAPGDGRITVIP